MCQSFLSNYLITINETNKILKNTYNVITSILENYLNAIMSRINYVLMTNFKIIFKYCILINSNIVCLFI